MLVGSGTVFLLQVIIGINGEKREFDDGLSVTQLLELLGIRAGRVVVEMNRDVLSREAYGTTILKDGDSLEIVHFVGGG